MCWGKVLWGHISCSVRWRCSVFFFFNWLQIAAKTVFALPPSFWKLLEIPPTPFTWALALAQSCFCGPGRFVTSSAKNAFDKEIMQWNQHMKEGCTAFCSQMYVFSTSSLFLWFKGLLLTALISPAYFFSHWSLGDLCFRKWVKK